MSYPITINKIKKWLIVLIISLISSNGILAQNNIRQSLRDSLNAYFKLIISENSDSKRLNLNDKVLHLMRESLNRQNLINPIDSVRNMGLLVSPDKNLNIYTWNIPFNNGTHKYFGFMQYYNKKTKITYVYELFDHSEVSKNPEYTINTNLNWFGALYYKIVESKYRGQVYYTLLSSDLNDLLTKKKIIEVLHFNTENIPVFGAKLFQNLPQNTRVFFEYNARANMALTFDEKLNMIVFDHLSPSKPDMKDVYEFYGPDFSYDAYKFEKGKWKFYQDIEVRGSID